MFTKNEVHREVKVYFAPTYMQNLAPGSVTYAQISFRLEPINGGESIMGAGRYSTLDLTTRPFLIAPQGSYKIWFSCSNISVRPHGASGEGQSYGVGRYATYEHPETITITGDTEKEVIGVRVVIMK